MTKKTRLIILLVCIACFLVGVPYIVLYSLGYRVDFAHTKIIATGGIYVRTFPSADQIIIDSKYFQKPGIFANSIFVQNLLPVDHFVLVKKVGYYDYSKTLPVLEKEVTKLENISLFRKNINFQIVTNEKLSPFIIEAQQEKYIIKNSNLYYSSIPQNVGITATQKATPVIKNILTFSISNGSIVWLGVDGFLYKSDDGLPAQAGKNPVKLTSNPLKVVKTGTHKIIIYGPNTFVNNNGKLLLLNNATDTFSEFASQVKDAKFSADGKNIVYFTNNEIYISLLDDQAHKKNLLYMSGETINNFLWLNNSYIIFSTPSKIIISEIDYRSNINIVTLPTTIKLTDTKTITLKSPQISFSSQENKLYILIEKTLLSADNLMP